ncbi:alpha/beta hydrolase [Acanthopleuribacter pedis]|uniref:Alpha/beta hydrolase n=1 Tax=Acanthopleuribacter pedis TaxID=442870 RepID=A0A8J7QIS0_9BACT|nr:alpha/beta hydrolase-fold protein [Acanthopleuribacter pedis]MBO1321521.1 alpha/beta hydrolase [Acanthopleuribacter pedis]
MLKKWIAFWIVLVSFGFGAALQAAEIRVHYDTGWGNRIAIRGQAPGLNWQQGVQTSWQEGNVWVLQTPASWGGFEFKPLFNDQVWSVGANYRVAHGNDVVDIYPFFFSNQGRLVNVTSFYSSTLGNVRGVRVYLPPSYDENLLKSYPVVYCHDGQNLFEAATAFGGREWRLDETSDALVMQGVIQEAIYVGIDNTGASRLPEYTPTADPNYGGGDGDLYLDFIENEVVPWIENSLRTRAGANTRFLMGSSLGGLISFYGSWTRSDVFGSAACLSSSFWWDNQNLLGEVQQWNGATPAARFYVDGGSLESAGQSAADMRDALVQLGFVEGDNVAYFLDQGAGHNEAAWAARLDRPLRFLLAVP